MKGKPQSAKKMRDKYYLLTRLWCGDDLLIGQEPMGDLFGQVSSFPELFHVFLRNGGSHPLAMCSRDGHGWSTFWGWKGLKLERWSLRADGLRKKKAWGEKWILISL